MGITESPVVEPREDGHAGSPVRREVCAVIASHNRRELLGRLLCSLREQTCQRFDVVVVENASTDSTADMVRQDFPHVGLIPSAVNLGASGGINIGLRHALTAGYRYCWLLDDDCVPAPDALERLLDALEQYPNLGLAASKVLLLDGSGEKTGTIHELGGAIDWRHGRLVSYCNGQRDADGPSDPYVLAEYVAMTSLLLRGSLLRQHGLLREEFFAFGEDIDLSLRYRRLGYTVAAIPASRVWHVSGAHKPVTPLREYYAARNYLFLFWESAPGPLKLVSLYHHLARILALMVTFYLDGQPELARAIADAVGSFYRADLRPFQGLPAASPAAAVRRPMIPDAGARTLVISRGATRALMQTLDRVRAVLPRGEVDVLYLHQLGERVDLGAYQVSHVYVRPSALRARLGLLTRLVARRYDLSVPTEPARTLLYESTARRTLAWHNGSWTAAKIRIGVKVAQRVAGGLISRVGAVVLTLAAPFRIIATRRKLRW